MSDCRKVEECPVGQPIIIDPPADPSFDCDCDAIEAAINAKQDRLIAGQNITIQNNVISASGGGGESYTAGENITIENGVISATDTTYTAGENVTIVNDVISATDTTYTAGDNVQIENNVISATDTTYTAGDNIDITNDIISATYTAGDNVTITDGEISVDMSKAKLLEILGYTDQTITKTDLSGNTVTMHVLGYIEEQEVEPPYELLNIEGGTYPSGTTFAVENEAPLPDGSEVTVTIPIHTIGTQRFNGFTFTFTVRDNGTIVDLSSGLQLKAVFTGDKCTGVQIIADGDITFTSLTATVDNHGGA